MTTAPQLSPAAPSRRVLTSREVAELIGAQIGGLVRTSEPMAVRDAIRWWGDQPDATWQALEASAEQTPAPAEQLDAQDEDDDDED